MEKSTVKYIEGLNKGFLMAQYEPELYKSIGEKLESFSKFTEGMLDGGRAYSRILEKGKDKAAEWMKGLERLRGEGCGFGALICIGLNNPSQITKPYKPAKI